MKGRSILFLLIALINYQSTALSQVTGIKDSLNKVITDTLITTAVVQDDSINRNKIILSCDQAIKYLLKSQKLQPSPSIKDPFRSAIGQLIFKVVYPPFDSTIYFLKEFLSDSTVIQQDVNNVMIPLADKVTEDTLLKADTNFYPGKIYTAGNYRYADRRDSIKAAVGALLNYLEARDSSIIRITGLSNKEYPLWLNSKSDNMIRFWLRNDLNDSVTVWIGNPARNTIGLYLEHGVSFRRPSKQGNISEARIDIEKQDNTKLVGVQKILTKSQFWKYHTEASFALNQGLLTNWVKGGESSISTSLDITWYADYSNKPMLLSSSHFARIKYGLIASGEEGIRKNLDLLETNSKLNHKAFGKFDFSGIMLFKTQVSKGYSYPNDSVPVSRFMNPAILTLGLGLDYKPDKFTSINFSPISYKVTFVPDTFLIDQTKYGISENRKSKHEPGASFLISNEFRPFKSVTVTNRLQLFTNYINNPQNIDVDWEMILKANLNWFTEVRLNTHLIFDDDTKTLVFDKDKNPVLGNDGIPKKTARVQFKELLGLSFVFRF